MLTFQKIQLRAFDVRIKDNRSGELAEITEDVIVFTKEQLRAAQIVGQSSRELIRRAYQRAGYTVMDIGKAHKAAFNLDLEGLYTEAMEEEGD